MRQLRELLDQGLGVRAVVERDQAQQHEDRAGQGVEEELDRRVLLARPAPDADQEVHGEEHDLPEDVEEEEVHGDEDAVHARVEEQVHGPVAAHVLFNRKAGEPGHEGHDARQNHHPERDLVDAGEVFDVERADPNDPGHELQVGGRVVEARPQPDADQEVQGQHRHAKHARRFGIGRRDQGSQGGARDRQEDQQCEVDAFHDGALLTLKGDLGKGSSLGSRMGKAHPPLYASGGSLRAFGLRGGSPQAVIVKRGRGRGRGRTNFARYARSRHRPRPRPLASPSVRPFTPRPRSRSRSRVWGGAFGGLLWGWGDFRDTS
jgi:hypothetical protein